MFNLLFNSCIFFLSSFLKKNACLALHFKFLASEQKKFVCLFFPFCLFFLIHPIYSEIPTPGNIIYGTIKIGNQNIISTDHHIYVSIKQGSEKLATYQMGSLERLGDSYLLKLPFVSEGLSLQEGDIVGLYVNDQFVKIFPIQKRASVIGVDLELDKQCRSNKSGYLLSKENYKNNDLFVCNKVTDHFIISDSHLLHWDGNNTLSGSIQVETGGSFHLNRSSVIEGNEAGNGEVILHGGTFLLENDYNIQIDTILSKLFVNSSSVLELSKESTLNILGFLEVSKDASLELAGAGVLQIPGDFYLYGILNIKGTTPLTLNVQGGRMHLANDLDVSQIHFLSDAQTSLTLLENITVTTSNEFTLGTLNLNQYALTLGSKESDMRVSNSITLSYPNAKIHTGDADLIFEEHVVIDGGEITSTSGKIHFKKGVDFISGSLDIQGGELNIQGEVTKNASFNLNVSNASTYPIAHAGENQEDVLQGQEVWLNGVRSFDLNNHPLSFKWKQIIVNNEPQVKLINSNQSTASFIAPLLKNIHPLTLTFELKVSLQTDPTKAHRSQVEVTIQPHIVDQSSIDSGVLNAGVYKVSEELDFLTVKAGYELILQKGVRIYFPENFIWVIYGKLNVQGSKEDSVILKTINENHFWEGLILPKTNTEEHMFRHVEILNANNALSIVESYNARDKIITECNPQFESSGSIHINYGNFKNNVKGVESCFGYPLVITNSIFENNTIGISKGGSSKRNAKLYYNQFIESKDKAMDLYPFGWVIENNEISNKTSTGIYIRDFVLKKFNFHRSQLVNLALKLTNNNFVDSNPNNVYFENQSNIFVDASRNWWEISEKEDIAFEVSTFIKDRNRDNMQGSFGKVGNTKFIPISRQQSLVSKPIGISLSDIDGDGKIDFRDVETLKMCISYTGFVKDSNASMDYYKTCSWVEDLTKDGRLDRGDLVYLSKCIRSNKCD